MLLCTEKGNGWSVALPASKVCDGKSSYLSMAWRCTFNFNIIISFFN
jgi:hypothetical protein